MCLYIVYRGIVWYHFQYGLWEEGKTHNCGYMNIIFFLKMQQTGVECSVVQRFWTCDNRLRSKHCRAKKT